MRTVHAISIFSQWKDKRSLSRETSETSEKSHSRQNNHRAVLLNKLAETFIPIPFGNNYLIPGCTLKDSFLGKILVFLSQRDSFQEKKETIAKIFKEAVDAIIKSNTTIPLELAPVITEINLELNLNTDSHSPIPLPENEGLTHLNTNFAENRSKEQTRIYENSLLRALSAAEVSSSSSTSTSAPQNFPKVENDTFLSIFRGKATSSALDYVFNFLGAEDPSCLKSPQEIATKQSLIKKGTEFISTATKKYLDATPEAAPQVLETLSQECLDQISGLNEPGAKWLFCGGYGQRVESVETAFKILKTLPKEVRDHLPHPFPAILEQNKLPDPEEFAQKAIHEALTEINNLFPGMEKILGFKGINAFFEDKDRALPQALSHILPSLLEKITKEGLLKQISAFVPNQTHSDLIDWIGSNRNILLNGNDHQRETKRAELERKIANEFKEPCENLLKSLDTWLFSTINSLQKNMPTELLEFIGFDNFLASGAMWIMFERQANDKMAVVIHASGTAMSKHPLFNNSHIEWPLRINDIDPEKINKDFIQQLLYHTLVPLKSSEAVSKAENIYAGPIKHLDGKGCIAPTIYSYSIDVNNLKNVAKGAASLLKAGESTPEAVRNAAGIIAPEGATAEILPVSARLHNELDVTLAALLNQKASLPVTQFNLRLKAFLEYTKQFLTGNQQTLEIKDAVVAANLEMAIKALITEASKIEPLLAKSIFSLDVPPNSSVETGERAQILPLVKNPDFLQRLHATAEEVNVALDKFKTAEEAKNIIETDHALQIPKKILDGLSNFLKQHNISTNTIKQTKGMLCWALGEDAEEIIDSLTDALEKDREISGNPQALAEKGWLKTILSSVYTHAAFNVLQVAWMFGRYSVGKTPTTMLLLWGNWGLQKILPNPIANWYKVVLNTILLEFSRVVLYIILRLFLFSTEEIEELQSFTRQWKHILKVWAKTLNSSQKLEFTFDPKIKDKGEVKLHLPKAPIALNPSQESFSGVSIQPLSEARLSFPTMPVQTPSLDHFLPLLHFAESFRIPTRSDSDEWDTAPHPEVLLDKFSTLASDIYNNITSFNDSPDVVSRAILAMYSTLVITDKLAKRCNISLKDKSINAYPFLAFIKGHGNQLKSPHLQERARQICSYFMPKVVDVDQLSDDPLNEPAIANAMRDSLFDYSKAHDYLYIANSNHLPEARFLNGLLTDPAMSEKLAKAGVSEKTPNRMKLSVLLEESLMFTRADPIVPPSFSHLKLHTLLANRLVTFLGTEGDKAQFIKFEKTAPAKTYNFNFEDQAVYKRAFSNVTSLLDKPTDHPLISTVVPSKNNCFYTDSTVWNAFLKGQPTQSEIFAAEKGRIEIPTSNSALETEISKGLEKVFVEKDDIILRALDFLDKYLQQVTDNNAVLMHIFDGVFFGFSNLEKQLKSAPQVAKTIISFLNRKIPVLIANKHYHHALWLISLGIRTKPFIVKINSDYSSDFPQFQTHIDSIIAAEKASCHPSNCYSQVMGYALQLKALGHPLPDVLPEQERKLAAIDFARAFFFPTNRDADAKEYTLTSEFREKYRHWLPVIKDMCSQNEARSELCTLLLQDRHASITPIQPNSTVTFIGGDPLNFKIIHPEGVFSFNFKTSYIDGPLKYGLGTYFRIREKVIEITKEKDLLVGEDIETPSGMKIKFNEEKDEIELEKTINVHNLLATPHGETVRNFVYIPAPKFSKHLLPFVNGDTAKLAAAKFWLEDTQAPIKNVYIELENSPPFLAEVKSSTEGFTLLSIHQDKKAYSIVPNRQFAHLLLPLTRFCPNDRMFCFTSTVRNRLSKLFFEPFGLSFNIVEHEKRYYAESVQHQGFHIAAQQIHPSLHKMPSYLLLKNNNDDARVLIPEEQWLSSAATTIIPKLGVKGSFARILERWFGSIQQSKTTEKQKLYSYDINPEGLLVSEDPESMMYLICLYLLQNKRHSVESKNKETLAESMAESTCQELIRVINLQKEKVDASKLMFMFSLVPASNTEVSRIRRLITAAIEEKNAFYAKSEENQPKKNEAAHLKDLTHLTQSMMQLNACKEDLEANFHEKEKRYQLTDDQELRLFNRFNTLAEELIKKGLGLPKALINVLETMGWEATSNIFLLPTHLVSRYDVLTSQFQKTKKRSTKAKNLLIEACKTPSSFTSYNYVETSSIFGLVGKMAMAGANSAKEIYVDKSFGISELNVPALAATMVASPEGQEINPPLDQIEEFFDQIIPQFSNYYAIAYGMGTPEQSEKLKKILILAKGGRSPTSDKLIQFLSFVQNSFLKADRPQALNKILSFTDLKLSEINIPALAAATIPTQGNPPLDQMEGFFNQLTPQFANYYAIALGKGTPEQSQKLKELLMRAEKAARCTALDKELIQFLSYVQDAFSEKTEKLKAFLESLNSNTIYHSRTSTLLSALGGITLDKTCAFFLNNVAGYSTYNMAFNATMHAVSKGVNMAWNALPKINHNQQYIDPSYAGLDDVDAFVDGALKGIFDIGFNEVQDESPLQKIDDFSEDDDKINASLKKYYESLESKPRIKFECKGIKALCEMQLALGSTHAILQKKCEQDLKQLMEIINSRRTHDKLNLQSLKKALLLDKWAKLGSDIGFSQEEMAHIEKALATYIVMSTRAAQLGRILENFKKLSLCDIQEEPMVFIQALQAIAVESKTSRAYKFADTSKRIALRYMIFELYTNTMVWDVQANPLTEMLQKKGNIFLVLLMSLGKTFQMIPMNDSYLADGKNVVFNVFADGLKETNTRQISRQGQTVFDQPANNMPVSRASMHNLKQLEAVNIMLSRAQSNHETVNIVPSEAQSLDANLMDLLYYAKRSGKKDLTLFLAQVHHKLALMMMRENGVAIQDEAHIQYNYKEGELNHPIGEEKSVEESYQNVMELCMRHLVANAELMEKIRTNSLEDLSKKDFIEKFAKDVAQKISSHPLFKLDNDTEKEAFVTYVTGNPKKTIIFQNNTQKDALLVYVKDNLPGTPAWTKEQEQALLDYAFGKSQEMPAFLNSEQKKVLADYIARKSEEIPAILTAKKTYENIALVKGVLSVLMPYLSTLNIHVDYALVGDNASPFAGNMQKHEGYSIQISFEKAIKTYVSCFNKGLSTHKAQKLYVTMFEDARAEMLSRSRLFKETVTYKKLCVILKDNAELLGKIQSENTSDIENDLIHIIKNNPEAILHYVRLFGYIDIKDWERCNRVNNQNFPSLWKRVILDTGTPYNIESSPDDIEIIDDEKTEGEALHLISTNCVEDSLILDAKSPTEILQKTLESSFKTIEYSILTDGNAVLKGLSNSFVADTMDKHCKLHRPDIKAIVYYTELNGKDQLVFREIGSDTPKPFDQCKHKPKEILLYVDDNHGEGTNVQTTGLQLILFKKQPLYRVTQQAFRKRTLREIFKLILSGNLAELQKLCQDNKKIRFAMTSETASRLCPNGVKPTVRNILEDARKTQKEQRLHANYITYRKKLHNVVRQLIREKLIFAKAGLLETSTVTNDIHKMNEIYPEFEDFLIPLVKSKPSELFGKNEKEVETILVNSIAKDQLYQVIAKSKHFSVAEKAEARKLLDAVKVPALPEKVTIYTDGKDLDIHTHDLLGAQTMVQAVYENETDVESRQQAQTAVRLVAKTPKRFVEAEWPKSYNYTQLDWVSFDSGEKISKGRKLLNMGLSFFNSFTTKIEFPALFKFNESLSFASNPSIKYLASETNPKLWFTNNYIPRVLNNFFGEPVEVCGKEQRDLFQVLVIQEKNKVSSVGCLSQHEATFWKGEVIKLQKELRAQNKRMFVYDIPTRTIRAGGKENDQNLLLTNREFLLLEVELKFLNGDDSYTQDQILYLKEWLSDKDLDAMEKAYYSIHSQRSNTSAARSDIEFVFQELRGMPALEPACV